MLQSSVQPDFVKKATSHSFLTERDKFMLIQQSLKVTLQRHSLIKQELDQLLNDSASTRQDTRTLRAGINALHQRLVIAPPVVYKKFLM